MVVSFFLFHLSISSSSSLSIAQPSSFYHLLISSFKHLTIILRYCCIFFSVYFFASPFLHLLSQAKLSFHHFFPHFHRTLPYISLSSFHCCLSFCPSLHTFPSICSSSPHFQLLLHISLNHLIIAFSSFSVHHRISIASSLSVPRSVYFSRASSPVISPSISPPWVCLEQWPWHSFVGPDCLFALPSACTNRLREFIVCQLALMKRQRTLQMSRETCLSHFPA